MAAEQDDRYRNRDGGFWVALTLTDPDRSRQAVGSQGEQPEMLLTLRPHSGATPPKVSLV